MSDIVLQLARLNAMHLLPQTLFTPKGNLRSRTELEAMLKDQLQRLDPATRTMLQTNVEDAHLQTWRQVEEKLTPREDDLEWFHARFGVRPRSARHMRQVLLRQNSTHLHAFIRSDGVPWSNRESALAVLRADYA